VLLSIDMSKTKVQGQPRGNTTRADNDYALAWVRQYGRGRVFYTTFAHNPYMFWDPKMLQFYLAATQFALGDLQAPTTPSAKLTQAVRAQENLDWRLALVPSAEVSTLFETIDRAASLGLRYVGGSDRQKVSGDVPKTFEDQLSNDEMRQIRLKLDAAGVRLLTYHITGASPEKAMQFARRMGVETVTTDTQEITIGAAPQVVRVDGASQLPCLTPFLAGVRGPLSAPTALIPTTFTVEFASDKSRRSKVLAQDIEFFEKITMQFAKAGGRL
jgi:hypothetical protein